MLAELTKMKNEGKKWQMSNRPMNPGFPNARVHFYIPMGHVEFEIDHNSGEMNSNDDLVEKYWNANYDDPAPWIASSW